MFLAHDITWSLMSNKIIHQCYKVCLIELNKYWIKIPAHYSHMCINFQKFGCCPEFMWQEVQWKSRFTAAAYIMYVNCLDLWRISNYSHLQNAYKHSFKYESI